MVHTRKPEALMMKRTGITLTDFAGNAHAGVSAESSTDDALITLTYSDGESRRVTPAQFAAMTGGDF